MQQDIADSLRESLAYFHQYCRYPVERLIADYQKEIINYRDDTWEAPQRAARLSAAVKNFKTSQMIEFIFSLANDTGIDLTPLVVKRLCASLFQRKGSQAIIVDIFGKKQRVHRSADSNTDRINDIARRYRLSATNYWSKTLSDIAKAKIGYQKEIRALKKKKKKAIQNN
ncbi:hypothetical protein F4V72_23360 [Salmonella enterica subsp. diarizonae]|uniref:Putative cytoplasmic protein n=1 Tax=Salmonella diarizonae TaxID=59204 RepID=A0A379XXA3_SALDZ|nr:hypothetical protein [Salmonella enterica]ECH9341660.1 hypothetical protein [Salmonella enterica subsp. diarizonae]EDU9903180.1 hypothetical protein [Salmonella enterica subsp. diarizonae]KAA8683477.1 hypothetical protein F4V72_23360 [Salmonella enterica subsp. diarizonae]SUI37504.1 putative cytoplasmic protein [Salmonella enterica subsp. diarizonae]VFS63619.1 putative cytoplasmic protein [Salmonella enterica subsp. diarizonae]